MEPIYYVIAILGCGDSQAACQQARIEPARYSTIQQCQAAMPGALRRNTDIDFPEIAAACQASSMRIVRIDDRTRLHPQG